MESDAYYSINRLEVVCCWGMAEDILLFDNWNKDISIGMSVTQAMELVERLRVAIREVERLEKGLKHE